MKTGQWYGVGDIYNILSLLNVTVQREDFSIIIKVK